MVVSNAWLLVRAWFQITRLDSALLGFMAVFVPHFSRTQDIAWSAGQALPLLFTCVITFIANDLDDVQRDTINHPERPLPGGYLDSRAAVAVYFLCLAAALYCTKTFVDERTAFWYYGLIATSVSYGYLVDAFPAVKALYVAATVAAPILIVRAMYPADPRLLIVAWAAFLGTLGRESCMDIRDRAGDAPSFVQKLPPKPVATVAFVAQAVATLLLATAVRRFAEVVALALMVTALGVARRYWFHLEQPQASIALMKLQFAVGLVFLA